MSWIVWATLFILVPLIFVYLIVARKLVFAVVLTTGWQRKSVVRWTALGAGLLNSFPVVFLLAVVVGGQASVPAFTGESRVLDIILVYPFWFGLVVVTQCFLIIVLAAVTRLVLFPLVRTRKSSWQRVESRLLLGIAAFLIVYSAIVIASDTWTVRITRTAINASQKAPGLAGKRIVFVSDVQGDGRTDRKELTEYVDRINGLHPDMVMFAGDLVSSGTKYIASTAEIMGKITAPLGRIAAVGDHDMFSNRDMVVHDLSKAGFVIADDSTIALSVDSTRISISLVTDTYLRRPTVPQLDTLALQAAKGDFRILLVHQPGEELVQFAEQHGYDLLLAGHTHGGGIALGIPGLFLWAPARLESKYMSGCYTVGQMQVIVTNGLGLTLAPFRFHAPAEITVLDLR